jgi:hypothetical protein
VGLLDDEVAARDLLLERNINRRDLASLPAASTGLARFLTWESDQSPLYHPTPATDFFISYSTTDEAPLD